MRTLLIFAALAASALAANLVSCTRPGIPSTTDRFPWWYAQDEVVTDKCVYLHTKKAAV